MTADEKIDSAPAAHGLSSEDGAPLLQGGSAFALVSNAHHDIPPTAAHPCVASTVSTARYLLAIFEVDRDEPRLTAAAVARRLGVSTPSAHEMIGRLETMGLVERHPLRLTADGMSTALVLSTRRRAARRLAHDVLGMEGEAADEEAHQLAATLSPLLGRRLTDWYNKQPSADEDDEPGSSAPAA